MPHERIGRIVAQNATAGLLVTAAGGQAVLAREGRSKAAISNAHAVLRLTRERLDAARGRRRVVSVCVALLGALGVVATGVLHRWNPLLGTRELVLAIALVLASVPVPLCFFWGTKATSREGELVALAESARMLAQSAKALRTAVDESDAGVEASDRRAALLAALLSGVERDIAEARDREWKVREANGTIRRQARIKPRNERTTITAPDGRELNAIIINLSRSGVAIEANLPGVEKGMDVMVGSHPAKAVRKLERGWALEFDQIIDASEFDRNIVL